jgi:phage gp36-like protein
MFISEKDLYSAIREYELADIVQGDPALIDIAISTAIGEMKPYLFRYDCEQIFSARGSDREPLLVRFAVDIAIFELVSIVRPDQDLENRRALYNRAIGWLREVRDEKMPCGLPLLPVDPEDTAVLSSSNHKRINYF